MGWKCTDCGSTSWLPTDADGLTAGDRAEQAVMNREALAEERAHRLFG